MPQFTQATDATLQRARLDPQFRRALLAGNLSALVNELNQLRQAGADPARARQMREGVEMAVRLAGMLQQDQRER
jgi:uncharacterized membrane protein YgcG